MFCPRLEVWMSEMLMFREKRRCETTDPRDWLTEVAWNTTEHNRPILKFLFLAKILVKLVPNWLISFINSNGLFESFQSGFNANHSTKTALLRLMNDLLIVVDSGKSSVFVLLDLSAAFDTVHHSILLQRLGCFFLTQFLTVFILSYLNVFIWNFCSSKVIITMRSPGFATGTSVLFNLHATPLEEITQRHNLSFYFYADETQLYLSLNLKTWVF